MRERLNFPDKERVAGKRAFREILPLPWLKAGAIGPWPDLKPSDPASTFFAPSANPLDIPGLNEQTRTAGGARRVARV